MRRDELTRWVGDTDAFLDRHWRSAPAVFRPGADAGPAAPLSLEEIDAAVAGGLLRVPHLELARAGDPVHSSRYTRARTVAGVTTPGYADPDRVRELLAEGATLVLRNVEHWHPATRALTRRLEGELGRRVEAFAFVTPPGAQGLDLHRDDADVLLLQGTGSKRWTVRGGPTGPDWGPGEVADGGPALLADTLGPGEVLYIPRGFAHEAVGSEGLSSHLSLTIREVGTQQLFASLQRLLLDGLPLPARPLDEAALHAAAELLLERFRTRLPELTAAALLDHARRAQLAEGAVPGLGGDPGIAALAARLGSPRDPAASAA
ncbi:cupin domain-containing protein [Streptomyces sp. NBC_01551]|uniref:JmjC domain-containing protein n=1 Tax=Streptomyces sp. NBC_01551 TaxID=2975876 RepID=UPI00225BDA88|nr:cupin domain-containing protein [Streptomyces sp. NBC_01551]MCX4526344.1 cupin domain-containing protein [Streptomyces sp. NBC_01551]